MSAGAARRNDQVRQACAEKEQAENDKQAAEEQAHRDRVGRRLGAAVAVVALALGGFAIWDSRGNAADVAELAATGQVAGARAGSLACIRGDPLPPGTVCDPDQPSLRTLNDQLVAAGLDPVAVPGPTANAYQVATAAGRAGGRLDTLRELRARGAVLPGVNLPGPAGSFPRR